MTRTFFDQFLLNSSQLHLYYETRLLRNALHLIELFGLQCRFSCALTTSTWLYLSNENTYLFANELDLVWISIIKVYLG